MTEYKEECFMKDISVKKITVAALSAVDHAGVPIEGFNFFDRLSNGFRDRVHQEAACSDAKG